jgi:hypothetical protein
LKGGQQLVIDLDTDKEIPQFASNLKVDRPASYSLQVVGCLDESWSDRLGGMKIDASGREGGTAVTTISGPVIDQAALFGVLKALYDMRLPLLSVECIEVK